MFKKYNINRLIFSLFVFMVTFNVLPVFAVKDVKSTDTQMVLEQKDNITEKINFDDVLTKAKEHSYDLKISDYNVLISKQGIRTAKSEYFPKFNFSMGTEYTKNFRDARESTVMSIGDAFINPYTRFQSVLGISVGYNLFDFGVRGGNLKVAKEDVKIKELETIEKLQELNLSLLDIYTKILVTSKQIELNKDILAIEEKNLEMKERLYQAKELSKTELNDEKVKVTITKNKIEELKSIESESLNWLAFYTGEKYDINNLKVAELKISNFDVLAFNDYTKSIIWQVHEKNIKKKQLEVQVAKRINYPKLNVYSKYYLYGSDPSSYGESLKIEPSNFSVGASLNMPVFDGFKNSANIQKTELELKQLQVERDKSIAQLMTRLATMRSNLIYLDNQINGNEKILKELSDKEKSIHKLVSKKIVSPIEENDVKIEVLNQKIEQIKNSITYNSIKRGIQILTEEY